MIKKILLFIFCFFMGCASVCAKEVNFYFYPNGGTVTNSDFGVSKYGYLFYKDKYYASYDDGATIKKINTIGNVEFSLSKTGTSLVSGREWYIKNNGKVYFLSNSKAYTVGSISKALQLTDDNLSSLDLYAHWNDNKISSGTDIPTGVKAKSVKISLDRKSFMVGDTIDLSAVFSPNGSTSEKVTWSSSNKKIATVDSDGVVKGIKEGKVTITVKSKSGLSDSVNLTVKAAHFVYIHYHMNGGFLTRAHGEKITNKGDILLHNGSANFNKSFGDSSISESGLVDVNNVNFINLLKNGYYIDSNAAWNTKADGSGKSFSQKKVYQASSFCDATKSDCTVTLYANWKKASKTYKIALIGNSKTYMGDSEHAKSRVAMAFRSIASSMKKSANVTTITCGGTTLLSKTDGGVGITDKDKKKCVKEKKDMIVQGNFDYVVMQEQTDAAHSSSSDVFTNGAKAVKKLLKNKNAKIYIRTSWPRNNSDFNKNVNKMNSNSEKVARAVKGTVVYDGKAFQAAKNAGISVYLPDNNHPSEEGAYLAAVCIYKYVFQEKASNITYYYGLGATNAKKLLSIADSYC